MNTKRVIFRLLAETLLIWALIMGVVVVPVMMLDISYENKITDMHQQLSSSNAAWLDAVMTCKAKGE